MGKIPVRERVLLGYDRECSRLESDPGSPEVVDFSDVFGGPPRRFSIQKDSLDFLEEEGDNHTFLVGFGEKPVFGNEVASRKNHPSNDFYDDIFNAHQLSISCLQSPRIVPARESVSSATVSRVTSPPLPPPSQPLLSPPNFRFNQTAQTQDVFHGDACLSYRPSPLSHQNSVDSKGSPKVTKLQDKQSNVKHSTVVLDSSQFHFSIYKWAGKGVPLAMPLSRRRDRSRSKENIIGSRFLSETERGGSDAFVGGNQKLDTSDDHSTFNSCNSTLVYSKSADSQTLGDIAEELSRSESKTTDVESSQQQLQLQEGVPFQDPKEFHEKDSFMQEESKANINPVTPENTKKVNMRTLGSFLQHQKKDETIVAEKGAKERKVKEKEKPSLDDFVPSRKVNKVKADSFREANNPPNPKKGQTTAGSKVKDFVKIFTQENFPKAAKDIRGQSQSQRWADTDRTIEMDNEIKPTTDSYHEDQASIINWETTPAEDSKMADGDSFLFSKPQSDVNGPGAVLPNEPITKEMKDVGPNIKAIPALNIKTAAQADILTKNAIQEIGKPAEVEYKDEMKSYENKIRQWSKGKDGNIRALLSTLQYVLWPNSGWKPVPLMEIIEANAVKRAYQKALLRLHPDKLQQKGAAALEKFIAEKVFDVLQEAWDQFNSLGAL